MKGIVSIFGGINQKQHHFKYAIEIYKKNDFKVQFYEGSYYGIGTLLPKIYKKNIEKAINTTILNNVNIPTIVHCHSGGFWSGLEFNSYKKQDAFILESSPLNCYNTLQFCKIINKIYFANILPTNKTFIEYAMTLIGTPTEKTNSRWFEEYEKNILKMNNVTFINGDKDIFIDYEYLTRFKNTLQKHNIRFDSPQFKEGRHANVAKSDINLYQDTIDKICKELIYK